MRFWKTVNAENKVDDCQPDWIGSYTQRPDHLDRDGLWGRFLSWLFESNIKRENVILRLHIDCLFHQNTYLAKRNVELMEEMAVYPANFSIG